MAQPDIDDDVRRFILDEIDTVSHLEALLLIWESAPATWTVDVVASRTYVGTETAAGILADLQRRGFVTTDEDEQRAWRYNDSDGPHAQLLPRVAATYRRHLILVAKMIHDRGPASVLEFARAFHVRKER